MSNSKSSADIARNWQAHLDSGRLITQEDKDRLKADLFESEMNPLDAMDVYAGLIHQVPLAPSEQKAEEPEPLPEPVIDSDQDKAADYEKAARIEQLVAEAKVATVFIEMPLWTALLELAPSEDDAARLFKEVLAFRSSEAERGKSKKDRPKAIHHDAATTHSDPNGKVNDPLHEPVINFEDPPQDRRGIPNDPAQHPEIIEALKTAKDKGKGWPLEKDVFTIIRRDYPRRTPQVAAAMAKVITTQNRSKWTAEKKAAKPTAAVSRAHQPQTTTQHLSPDEEADKYLNGNKIWLKSILGALLVFAGISVLTFVGLWYRFRSNQIVDLATHRVTHLEYDLTYDLLFPALAVGAFAGLCSLAVILINLIHRKRS